MILIADSGSTKTHWCVMENGQLVKHIFTKGISPFYQTENEIALEVEMNLLPGLEGLHIDKVYFYGTGCAFPDKKIMVSDALGRNFPDTIIEVHSDLLAAAHALFQRGRGVACILGTGSNSCLYDGGEVVQHVSPLGYVLGDEGSGAVLGRTLIADCLKNQLPGHMKIKLIDKYGLTPESVLENVYKKPFPNRYLAQFTPFLKENLDEPSIYNIVYSGFDSFLMRNVMQYPLGDVAVGFVGSIAFHFSDVLAKAAAARGIVVSEIAQAPMDGLIKYYSYK